MFFAVLADCAFWYFCSSCMLKTVVRKEEHHLRHFLLCEMCISPLMVVFVEEKRYNFNECEFSIWWGAGWQLCPVLLVCIAAAFVDRVDGQGGLWCCQVIAVSFCSALNLGMTSGQPHRLELRVKILLAQRDTAFASWGSQGATGLEGWERSWLKIPGNEQSHWGPSWCGSHMSWKGWQIVQLRKKMVCALKATCSICKVVFAGPGRCPRAEHGICGEVCWDPFTGDEVGWYSKGTQGLDSLCPTSPWWWALCCVPALWLLLCPQAGEGVWEGCKEEFLPLWY